MARQLSTEEVNVMRGKADANGMCQCSGCPQCSLEIEAPGMFAMGADTCVIPAENGSSKCDRCGP